MTDTQIFHDLPSSPAAQGPGAASAMAAAIAEQRLDGSPCIAASPMMNRWPATPGLEAILEPPMPMSEHFCSLDGSMVKHSDAMAAFYTGDGAALHGFDPWLPEVALPDSFLQDPSVGHGYMATSDHSSWSFESKNGDDQDSMLYHNPWMYMPYPDLSACPPMSETEEMAQWSEGAWPHSGSMAEAGAASGAGTSGSSTDASAPTGPGTPGELRTTVMLRSLPETLTREDLLDLLDKMGFYGKYDLVYIPVDFSTGTGLGYAFINMINAASVPQLWEAFDGLSTWANGSNKVCTVSWSNPHQGLAAHIERYQNSPVMHPDVPDEWKPALFLHGQRMEFPPPTKKVKAPKVRNKSKAVDAAAAAAFNNSGSGSNQGKLVE